MVKIAVIAAAGKGTRMLHLSKNKPKHLIEVNQKPFLYYLLSNLIRAGFSDLIVVVGYKGELIEQFLKEYNFKAKTINQYKIVGEKKQGTACPLMCVQDLVKNKEFLFVYGDNLFSVRDLKSMRKQDGYNYIAGVYRSDPQKYGVLAEEGDFLKKIAEKPKKHIGNLINAGLYKLTPEIFEKIPKIKSHCAKNTKLQTQ